MKSFLLISAWLTLGIHAAENKTIVLSPGKALASELETAVATVKTGRANLIAFTAGEFKIDKPLQFHLPFGHPGLRFQGTGCGITQLLFHEVKAAISIHLDTRITHTESNPSLIVEDLSMIATGKCGTAINLQPGVPDHRVGIAHKRFHNLMIQGRNGSWTTGIQADDLAFCTFRDLNLRLPRKDSTGIHLTGASAPVDHHFDGIRILGGETGIRITGTVEGVYLSQITMIGTGTGIDWDTTSHEPLLSLSRSHISARSTCVRANNLLQAIITGNLFYQADPQLPWTGIHLRTENPTPFDLHQISNNTFHGHPKHSSPNSGLNISAASSGAIANNIFSATDIGIRLGGNASKLEPVDSVFKNTTTKLARQ
ncbi:MAG: hypothetical protein ACI9UA_004098 [Pseudoalteromonas tetraodonis]|jgi:hypothetical protein